ncbi:helix-turn-helix transcriptional regulator [Tengunoibacter tsumagoiensis]|nr:YafY family protein [Tengunoibacter tsumagoiensis]
MQKTERLVAITLLLQARGKMTAQRLAEILGVSTRTIYRDVIALSLAHVPVSMEYGPGGGYYLPDDYHLESAIFTREEAISLILSTDMSGTYNLFGGDGDLQRALMKLESVLSDDYRKDVNAARERLLYDTSAWRDSNNHTSGTHLETLRTAVLGANQLEILYPYHACTETSPGAIIWRRVEPYGLVFQSISRRYARTGRWYLVAFCLGCQAFHTFRVGYIEQVYVRSEEVTPRPNFNLRAYWCEACKQLERTRPPLNLVLRVSPAARYGLKGNTMVLKEEHDGSVIVRVETESSEEAVAYALSLGPDAIVVSPEQIREAVAANAQAIVDMYKPCRHSHCS